MEVAADCEMQGPAAGESIKGNGFATREFLWHVAEMKAPKVTNLPAIDFHNTDRFSTLDNTRSPSVAGLTMSRCLSWFVIPPFVVL